MPRTFAHLMTAGLLGACLMMTTPATHASAAAVSEEEAQAIAVEAYLYLYSLVTMDLTRLQFTNVEESKGFEGPMNSFVNVPAYPTAEMRTVVRPNFDTLYSSAWLDLTKEPMIVSVPDTDGRYYLLPMLDMWTDVIALAGLAHDGHGCANLPGDTARLDRHDSGWRHGAEGVDALCLDHRSHQDGRPSGL
jgi:hypothetical protein